MQKDEEVMSWFLEQPSIVNSLATVIGGMDRLERVTRMTSPLAKTSVKSKIQAVRALSAAKGNG